MSSESAELAGANLSIVDLLTPGVEAPASIGQATPFPWTWLAVAALVLAALLGLAVVLVARPTSYACTGIGGPIFDVRTADEAFDLWWQTSGPDEAARLTDVFPAAPARPPAKEDFVRRAGRDGSASWTWDFADGQSVDVTVDRVVTNDGWMVAANRCSS